MAVAQTSPMPPGSPTSLMTGERNSPIRAIAPVSERIFTPTATGIMIRKRRMLTERDSLMSPTAFPARPRATRGSV